MLKLIARLRAWPDEREVYLLNSHFELCLLAHDDYTSPWYVKILAIENAYYRVRYLMPARLAPWQGAFVSGESINEDAAFEMTLTAMDKSEGWTDADPQGWKKNGRDTRRLQA